MRIYAVKSGVLWKKLKEYEALETTDYRASLFSEKQRDISRPRIAKPEWSSDTLSALENKAGASQKTKSTDGAGGDSWQALERYEERH